ncbi:MAG: hypothetical protein RMK91_07165 [Pseudanabaenaceae cyanobacterium SKYGB_i_bin29]|nr:hypothetical protein [Pseudanabaenaceae cyanobacterium SKYG29]MDW8421632.1 hypothetical protein [Pseudanabaenaceae cyanobacterium SKYGB_i_bin29]
MQSKEIFYTLSLEFDLRRINNLVLIEKPIGVVIEFADGDEILEYELYFRTTADRDKLLNFLASVIERTVDDREYNQG